MAATALSKIAGLLGDALKAARPDLTCFTAFDRDPSHVIDEADLPAVVINIPHDAISPSEEHGQLRHEATVMFSIEASHDATNTVEAVNQDIAASIVETLYAGGDFGGCIEFLDPATIDATEQDNSDVGEALLTFNAVFYTPAGDIRHVIRAGGGLL